MAMYVNAATGPCPMVGRNSAGFHPSIWGDKFLPSTNSAVQKSDADCKEDEKLQLLKQEVKKMLTVGDTPQQELIYLIDDIQRLGLSYHFETEIETLLQHLMDSFLEYYGTKNCDNLHDVALSFRLLRQEGHNVSSDVFSKFQDRDGKFEEKLAKDVRGMLSLFEAAQLKVHGENILEDAEKFTTSQLDTYLNSNANVPLADLVRRALKYPLRKSFNRMVASHYIPIYHKFDWHKQVLLDMAKCDFNLVQKVHQEELGYVTRWWKDLDFTTKLPFARDRVVECYFWICGVYFEPRYAAGRRFATKVICLTSIIDDIYDVYGTPEELLQLSDAIDKWDISILDQLPEYMQHVYKPLLDVFAEGEEVTAKQGLPTYRVDYAKKAFKRLVGVYHHEAKWLQAQYIPTFEEYISIANTSAGIKMLAVSSFVLMGDVATREAFEWHSKDPLILVAGAGIARLMNDIVGHEIERKRPHVSSAVECYMKTHDVTKETAYAEINKSILNAWKDMNEECLRPEAPPKELLERVFNLTRVSFFVYANGHDGYTDSSTLTKEMITSILVDPISG
ncbi:sesquiterpene synthase 2-like [Daucus carota subsp. sativus]|uniref:sesquiterpene synthase 2-like n=1 Tax=Daucus carota subsp. sativus TaxID=79200 RepID=UPI0007EF3D0E|nr:PREDICTED: sesquiterpene synthase 2-like [Daucus carota subsp. sativus]